VLVLDVSLVELLPFPAVAQRVEKRGICALKEGSGQHVLKMRPHRIIAQNVIYLANGADMDIVDDQQCGTAHALEQ
jgi:hypothetical protein